MNLARKKCIPCSRDTPPLRDEALQQFYKQLKNGWKIVDQHHLEKEYRFDDFKSALAFTNRVGGVAEEEGHHPDIILSWGKVVIRLWTHKINGLAENDFIVASKIDAL
jgi:4a-hydroxytetrahydrobiopterin dehydratase